MCYNPGNKRDTCDVQIIHINTLFYKNEKTVQTPIYHFTSPFRLLEYANLLFIFSPKNNS